MKKRKKIKAFEKLTSFAKKYENNKCVLDVVNTVLAVILAIISIFTKFIQLIIFLIELFKVI